jgi:hypothetical protein
VAVILTMVRALPVAPEAAATVQDTQLLAAKYRGQGLMVSAAAAAALMVIMVN